MLDTADQSELKRAADLQKAGRLREAEHLYQQLLARHPRQAELFYNLAGLFRAEQRLDDAIAAYEKAVEFDPYFADAWNNLGLALEESGRLDDAIAAFRQAITAAPKHAAAYNNLGNVLRKVGKLTEAVDCYQTAIAHAVATPTVLNNLGVTCKELGRIPEALRAFHQALLLDPSMPEIHNQLGVTLKMVDRLDEAIECLQRACQLRPNYVEGLNNLGAALKDVARLDEAIGCFERALEIKPPRADVHSNLIFTLLFRPDSRERLSHELQRYNRLHARRFESVAKPPHFDRAWPRKLRVGYFSPDFREHCAACFLLPLLAAHDRNQFEIHCFAQVLRPDHLTDRFMTLADGWHNCVGLDDDQLAEMIREAGIDILIDCTLHMGSNRLLAFARRPAPLQLTWLGYPGSTGLQQVDYRLTDPHLEPVDYTGWFEKPARLPETFWCYDPLTAEPEVNPLPASIVGSFTFGCLNNFCKLNEPTLQRWAEVLSAVDDSRLILLAPGGSARDWVSGIFSRAGVDPARIQFQSMKPRRDYLRLYHQIDLCLDTFPYNGHTTSLDGLWMGVPAVTLSGSDPVSRAGLCQLRNLNLNDFIANDLKQFRELAVNWTRQLPLLSQLRSELRHRIESSPLMNAPRFAQNMGRLLGELWENKLNAGE